MKSHARDESRFIARRYFSPPRGIPIQSLPVGSCVRKCARRNAARGLGRRAHETRLRLLAQTTCAHAYIYAYLCIIIRLIIYNLRREVSEKRVYRKKKKMRLARFFSYYIFTSAHELRVDKNSVMRIPVAAIISARGRWLIDKVGDLGIMWILLCKILFLRLRFEIRYGVWRARVLSRKSVV